MLNAKRLAGIAPEVNLRNLSLWHQVQTSPKVQTGVSVAPRKGLISSNICFYGSVVQIRWTVLDFVHFCDSGLFNVPLCIVLDMSSSNKLIVAMFTPTPHENKMGGNSVFVRFLWWFWYVITFQNFTSTLRKSDIKMTWNARVVLKHEKYTFG